MSNKAKFHTVAILVGAFVLLSTLGLTTLIIDKQELQQDINDLKVTNSQISEMNDNLKVSNLALQDESFVIKESLQKMDADIKSLKSSIEEYRLDSIKLKTDNKKLKEDNSHLQNKVSSAEKARISQQPSRGKAPTGTEIYMSSTAYTAYCNGCSGTTRTGINLRANPNLKVIAVDPSVIPLGTKVYVEGYGYAVAGDTGGAIKGYKIDVFIADKGQALNWGRKKVKVTILK